MIFIKRNDEWWIRLLISETKSRLIVIIKMILWFYGEYNNKNSSSSNNNIILQYIIKLIAIAHRDKKSNFGRLSHEFISLNWQCYDNVVIISFPIQNWSLKLNVASSSTRSQCLSNIFKSSQSTSSYEDKKHQRFKKLDNFKLNAKKIFHLFFESGL